LVPEPSAGRVFERELRPGIVDVSASGRARLDAIARWLQDVAYADLVDAGFEGRGAWIVRRTRLRVDSFPRFGEDLTLRTFCSGIGRFSAERRTDVIATGGPCVQAVALWICLDPEARRPMRFSEDFVEAYAPSAGGRDANVRLRHPDPPPDATREVWRFRATEVDAAGHVNNSHYWVPLEEGLVAGTEPEAIDAEIEYRDPAQPGEVTLLSEGSSVWIAGPDGTLHASVLVS
jgi:acyl-ACP thioesterase